MDVVDLSNRHLQDIEEELVHLLLQNGRKLSLSLSGNRLQWKSFPKSFWNLAFLVQLNLSFTDLEYIGAALGQLCNLIRLDLSNNRIHSLPREIRQLRKLNVLLLSNNALRGLPGVNIEEYSYFAGDLFRLSLN